MLRKATLLLAIILFPHTTLADQVTLKCKMTKSTILYSYSINSTTVFPPEDNGTAVLTFEFNRKKVLFSEGDSYDIDSVSSSIITWHDGPDGKYTFNRDALTGQEVIQLGKNSLTYKFEPCTIEQHRF